MKNPFRISFVTLLILSLLGLGGCHSQDPNLPRPDANAVVVQAGEQTVTAGDILLAFQEQHSYDELNPNYPVPAIETIHAITEQWLFTQSLAAKARGAGLDQTDVFQKNHQKIIQEELYQKLLLEDVLKKIQIADKQIERFYDENRETLFKKRNTNLYKIRGIKISVATWGKEKAAERAQAAYDLIKKGNSFKAVAVEYSDSLPTQRGTLMDIPSGGFGSPEIEFKIANLRDGDFTEPYLVKENFLIHLRESYIPPAYSPFEEVREAIIQKILQEEKDRRITLNTQELLQKFNCMTNPDLLSQPDSDPSLIILSVPGIYELSLAEFTTMALQNNKITIVDQQEYLSLLALKSVCYAEALDRNWGEEDIARTVKLWDDTYLAQAWVRHELGSRDEFSVQKFQETYEKNIDHPRLRTPPVYELYHIFFKAPITLSMSDFEINTRYLQSEQKAYQALERIKEGVSFDLLAHQYAQEGSGQISAGFLGNIPIDNRWIEEIGNLTAGQVSHEPKRIENILKNQFGYQLFYVKNIKPGDIMTLDEWKELMLTLKSNEWSRQLGQEYRQEILDQSPAFFPAIVDAVLDYLLYLRDHPEYQADIVRYAGL